MESNPFPELKIDSPFFLNDIKGRSLCPKCGKSRKFYCYSCYLPLGGPEFESKVPKIKLPVKIDIIKHPLEIDGKSTAVHAGILCPDDVTIYTYPTIPEYSDKEKVLLVFPGADAVTFEEYVSSKCSRGCSASSTVNQDSCSSSHISAKTLLYADDTTTSSCSTRVEAEQTGDLWPSESILSACTDSDEVNGGKIGTSTEKKNGQGSERVQGGSRPCCKCEQSGCERCRGQGSSEDLPVTDSPCCNNDKKRLGENDGLSRSKSTAKKRRTDGEDKFHTRTRHQPTFERVVFIDSTWHTVNKICLDERLAGIQRIELKLQKTKFWRYQLDKPDTYLSTIEAVYYFLREYHNYFYQEPYTGGFDNLLFYFVFMYEKIRLMYEGGKKLKAYSNPSKS